MINATLWGWFFFVGLATFTIGGIIKDLILIGLGFMMIIITILTYRWVEK